MKRASAATIAIETRRARLDRGSISSAVEIPIAADDRAQGALRMAVDMSEIVGPSNMTATSKEAVIELLSKLPTDARQKRYLYARWARLVGFQARPEDIDRVATWGQQ